MACNCSKDSLGEYQCNGEFSVVSRGRKDLEVALVSAFAWLGATKVWAMCLSARGVVLSFLPQGHNPLICPENRNVVSPLEAKEAAEVVWKWLTGTLDEPPELYLYIPPRQGVNLDREALPHLRAEWPPEPHDNKRRKSEQGGIPFVKGWYLGIGGRDGFFGCVTVSPLWMRFPCGPNTEDRLEYEKRGRNWTVQNERFYHDRCREADGLCWSEGQK